MKNRKKFILSVVGIITISIFTSCVTKFSGKTPTISNDIRFITGNEIISKNNYEVKGVVVVRREKIYFDFFGLIKSPNEALTEVFSDDIANELTQKVKELGANAVTDMQVIRFGALPGGFLYLLPIGSAQIIMQATALKIK